MDTDDMAWGQFISEVFECTAGHVNERRLQTMHAAAFPELPYSPLHRAAIVNFLLHEVPVSIWDQPEARDALHHNPVAVQVK